VEFPGGLRGMVCSPVCSCGIRRTGVAAAVRRVASIWLFCVVIVGMLYKIVPFLIWLHLQNQGQGS